MAIGIVVGCMAALAPPPLARLITGLIDILVAFPGLLLALFFAIIFGIGPQGAVLALGTAMTPAFARLTYTLAAGVVGRDYVSAARTLGISRARILFRHVLPNIGEPLIINGTLAASSSLLAFAGLSFLGLGVQLPDYDWGRMLSDGLNSIYTNPLAALAPGLAIVLASLAFNLSGEAGAQLLGRRVSLSPVRARRLVDEAIGAERQVRDDRVPDPEDAVLRVEGLSVAIPLGDDTVATPVRDLTFVVGRGEAVGIVGESGSGKTLTAMAVSQLTDPRSSPEPAGSSSTGTSSPPPRTPPVGGTSASP
nr:ABC transporter permease subunit [Ornithinimicrobium pratense]